MARAADTSSTYMPRALVALAAILLLARVVVWLNTLHSGLQPQISHIRWTPIEDFDKPYALAKGKLILYKFCADWSDPCQRLESEVLINHKVSDLASADFVPVAVTDKLRERGSNPEEISELQKRYHVFAFPTLVIADANGDSKGMLVGCSSSLATYRFLARAAQTDISARK